MNYENLLLERRGPVALVTVNRPQKMNALTVRTRAELVEVFTELGADSAMRVIVITGAGDKAFVAGADISEFAGQTAVDQRLVMRANRGFDAMESCPRPVIAMINGYALGGGCELALACDIRIASANAKFGQPEIRLGLIPGGGGTQRLTRLVGEGRAMELILTGDTISADEALRIGLVNRVCPPEELEATTMALAGRIAEMSPAILALAKQSVKNAARLNLAAGLDAEIDLFSLCFATADKEEGVRAFLEKRKPAFTGR